MMPLDKIKTPLLITICWPYLGRLHSVKNNVRNMAIIYLIQRNINVVQKIILAGWCMAYGHKMRMHVLLRIIHVFVRVI